MQDLFHDIDHRRAISPTRVTDNTAQTSQIIDRANFNSLLFVIATGTLADADATFTVLVQEGDASDLSDAASVADSDLIGTESGAGFTFANDDEVRKIGYIGAKRYVRIKITPAANSGNADLSAVALLSNARLGGQTSQS